MAASDLIPSKGRNHKVIARSATCLMCGDQFSWTSKFVGPARKFCSDFCRTKRRFQNAKTKPLCVVEGCSNPRMYKSGICNSCYYRKRRTGTLNKRVWSYRSLSEHGYVVLRDKEHPLSTKDGLLYEHRKVLYDAIGPGEHSCYWCGTRVKWIKGRCVRGSLVPDHLDGDKQNNERSNLVPACNKCNATRGLFMSWVRRHRDDPWLWRMYVESLGSQHGGMAVLHSEVADPQGATTAA